jgi:fermentation-respiration switch protein FrsA (DUF1100 family)
MVDYRGYGKSEGSPSEKGLYRDARAALAEARRRTPKGVPLIVYGRSLGGAVAIHLAAEQAVDGLIVESSFTKLRDAARRAVPIPFVWLLVAYRFDSIAKIARIEVPILIAHGDRDEVVPFEMGQQLHCAAQASREARFHRIAGAGHNDTAEVGGEALWRAFDEFVSAVAAGAGAN